MTRASDQLPAVTVGLPVFNGARHVGQALESLLRQDYPALTIVVSDNASTDGTWDVIQEFAQRDVRVRLVRQERNIGSHGNFAAVLAEATTPYFMWAAHDDLWEPDFVRSLVEELEQHHDAVVAMTAVGHITNSGLDGPIIRYSGSDNPNGLSSARLALLQAASAKHFQFIYGLYRTFILRQIFQEAPQVACWDGLFVLHAALVGRFRYVDRVLTTRTLSDVSWGERYPEDLMSRRMLNPFAYLLTLLAAVPYLGRSPAVPLRRKLLLLPVVLARLAAWLVPLSVGTLREQRRARQGSSLPDRRGG